MMTECCKHPAFVFVFGSNLAGRHGMGAAAHAWLHHGAEEGFGYGYVASHHDIKGVDVASFAIPTKDWNIKTLPLVSISHFVAGFKEFTRHAPHLTFLVTRIGCGLAGYTDADIAPMFQDCPPNCILPAEWLGGTFSVALTSNPVVR